MLTHLQPKGKWNESRLWYATSGARDSRNTAYGKTGLSIQAKSMWERLLYWEANNYIMCASIDRDHGKPGEKGTPGDKDGLIGQHAYSLLAAYEADGERLVKLRNPHGKGEWKGKWCDGNKAWSDKPAVADACGVIPSEKKNDGIFFMRE